MKKLIIIAVMTAYTSLAFAGNNGTTIWSFLGNDKLESSNSSLQDWINYLDRGALPSNTASVSYRHDRNGNLVTPVPLSAIQKSAEKGYLYNRFALVARLNQINLKYGYCLTGGQPITIDANNPEHWKTVMSILTQSGLVFEAPLPTGVNIVMNGNLVSRTTFESLGTAPVTRQAHILKDGTEGAWWIKLPPHIGGAEGLASRYCLNTVELSMPATPNTTGSFNQNQNQGNSGQQGQQGCGNCQQQTSCGNCGSVSQVIPVASIPVASSQINVPQSNTMIVSPVQVNPIQIGGNITVLPSANINTNRNPVRVGNSTNVGFSGVNTTTGNGRSVNTGFGNNTTNAGMGTNVQQGTGQARNKGFN